MLNSNHRTPNLQRLAPLDKLDPPVLDEARPRPAPDKDAVQGVSFRRGNAGPFKRDDQI
jgi:hypothetical protein